MTAQIIDGNALSKQLRTEVATRAQALKAKGITPGLAVVLVGDNPASQVYVRNKVKACEDSGLHSVLEKYEATMTEADLLARVEALNNDPSIHGILVQLPLPAHIDAQKVIEAISPAKDVDGFHPMNVGALVTGNLRFVGHDAHQPETAATHYGARERDGLLDRMDGRPQHSEIAECGQAQRGIEIDGDANRFSSVGCAHRVDQVEVRDRVDQNCNPLQRLGIGTQIGDGATVGARIAQQYVVDTRAVSVVGGQPDGLGQVVGQNAHDGLHPHQCIDDGPHPQRL